MWLQKKPLVHLKLNHNSKINDNHGVTQQWSNHDVNVMVLNNIQYSMFSEFLIPPKIILNHSWFGTRIDCIPHAPGGAHRPFTAGNRLQLMSSHLWSGAMWLHTLPQLTRQSWQKERLEKWRNWITINNYDFRNSSQHLVMQPIQQYSFPSNFYLFKTATATWEHHHQVAPVKMEPCAPGGTSRALENFDPNLPTTKPLGETCDPPSAAGRDVETTRNGRSIRSLVAQVATF